MSPNIMASPSEPKRPRVFVDADVLFAGSASPSTNSASAVVLGMGEITLIEAVVSQQVITECERNLEEEFPDAVPAFRLLVSRSVRIVPDPAPDELEQYHGLADPKDLPILVAALSHECRWLVTFNTRHYQPGHESITVMRPGEFVVEVRHLLARLGS